MGRIADIHHLLPESGLHIVGEHFLPIHHQLLGLKNATLDGIKTLYSQAPALAQARNIVRERKLGDPELVRHGRLRQACRGTEGSHRRGAGLVAGGRTLWPESSGP